MKGGVEGGSGGEPVNDDFGGTWRRVSRGRNYLLFQILLFRQLGCRVLNNEDS